MSLEFNPSNAENDGLNTFDANQTGRFDAQEIARLQREEALAREEKSEKFPEDIEKLTGVIIGLSGQSREDPASIDLKYLGELRAHMDGLSDEIKSDKGFDGLFKILNIVEQKSKTAQTPH